MQSWTITFDVFPHKNRNKTDNSKQSPSLKRSQTFFWMAQNYACGCVDQWERNDYFPNPLSTVSDRGVNLKGIYQRIRKQLDVYIFSWTVDSNTQNRHPGTDVSFQTPVSRNGGCLLNRNVTLSPNFLFQDFLFFYMVHWNIHYRSACVYTAAAQTNLR